MLCALAGTPNASSDSSSDAQHPNAPENLNSRLEPIRKKYDLPALAGAIVTNKSLSAVGAVGVRKYGTDTPVTVDDQFHLGSDTKAIRDDDRHAGRRREGPAARSFHACDAAASALIVRSTKK